MNWFLISFCIIAVSLFLITKYYLLKKQAILEKIETFENKESLTHTEKLKKEHNITLQYLNSNEARKLIKKDGEYLQGMNQANLSARKCDTIEELYYKYLDAFDDITYDERNTINKFALRLLEKIQGRNYSYYNYVVKWMKTINIAKAKPWLEAGMPHTLENTIIMDADWFTNPRASTFIHEITHVQQRMYPVEFEDLYPTLGYYYYPHYIKGMEQVYAVNRNNPDGTSTKWLWTDAKEGSEWWIGAIFTSVTPQKLTDVNMVALKMDKGADGSLYYLKQNPVSLSSLKPFVNFFGENPNNYHPNEMMAKFAEWYLADVLMESDRSKYYKYEGYMKYKSFFENMIGKFY
jgi:hypothetical protein